MERQKLLAEFFICPYCEKPLISKGKLKKEIEDGMLNYCTQCGKSLASVHDEALAQAQDK